ncbi:peptidoglycan-binding protein [Conexibacter arvalis]|uniref:Peptidoglycan binding-like domain-containing protein n=1 Tax=Conexibacter arvalis TaxID=912552 RepID=A0A840IJZ6_9ACTN|nr:peptidoglycan-binding domain-containing protein [Conexibacter arvalis]MBB4665049.1 hypothetical protein [Conexibacter arvalis]
MTAALTRHTAFLLIVLLGALSAFALAPAAEADAAKKKQQRAKTAATPKKPRIVFIRCSSQPFPCQGSHSIVVRTGRMLIGAGGMTRRAKVEFPVRNARTGKVGKRRVGGTFRTRTRIVVRVPGNAISGRIRVVMPGPRYSNRVRVTVRRAPLPKARAPARSPIPSVGRSAFDGGGMWVWYLSRSERGDPEAMAARAAAAGVRTVFVKSADGTNVWSQFSSSTVAALKATGLNVCGWHFVYGNDPIGEARASAAAKTAGADCFVIDAETAYEGKYAQAQRYVRALRAAVGDDFPIGLTSFPYVHYHGSFPYSVFMGPGGATFNLPQVYWKEIGDTPDRSLQLTYQYNTVYKTPIFPLGQAYDAPPASEIRRFRQLSEAYGARGISWWVWDFARPADWAALGADLPAIAAPADPGWPTLALRSKGDLVVWAQQHLAGAGHSIAIDGDFGAGTQRAVRAYQAAKGLTPTGAIDAATWPTLLRETPREPNWVARASKAARAAANGKGARAATAAANRLPAVNGPTSASMRARRYEIAGGPPRRR